MGAQRTVIHADRLPPPYATESAKGDPVYLPHNLVAPLRVPKGFRISLFAELPVSPRWLAVAPNGDVFVTESYAGRVVVLRDTLHKGVPDTQSIFASGLNMPHGMAFQPGFFYLANTDSIVRFPYKIGDLIATSSPEVVVRGIPSFGRVQHWTRSILFERDGKHFYVTVGSAANKAVEDPPRATISRYNLDGSGRESFATGMRNPVGFGFRPGTDELWSTCVERDYMGDDVPPEFFTRVRRGDFYGYPWTYTGGKPDPRAPEGSPPKSRMPDVLFTAHSVPLGMVFYTGKNFPARYRGDVFIAMRGSTNRTESVGYQVVRVPFRGGKPVGGYEPFVTGWLADAKQHTVYGRPVGLAVWTDGSLLVSDETAHKIWRVEYVGGRRR